MLIAAGLAVCLALFVGSLVATTPIAANIDHRAAAQLRCAAICYHRARPPNGLSVQFKMGIVRAYGRGQYCFNIGESGRPLARSNRVAQRHHQIFWQVWVRARSPKMDRRACLVDEARYRSHRDFSPLGFSQPAKVCVNLDPASREWRACIRTKRTGLTRAFQATCSLLLLRSE